MTVSIKPSDAPLREHFRLLRAIGGDESADDYLAIDRRSGKQTRIRVIRPGATPTSDARESILGRLAMASSFGHPSALPVMEVGLDAGRIFVVCDSPNGRSLAERLTEGPATLSWSAPVLLGALRVAIAAHEAGISHPGLSPSNVFVSDSGEVQISDFGLPLLPPSSALPSLARISGAARVRAPEMVTGGGADLAAQQYAVAALGFWLLAGTPPYPGDSIGEVVAAQKTTTPIFDGLSTVTAPLADALARSLALDPTVRGESLSSLLSNLEAIVPVVVEVQPPEQESRGRSAGRRFWWFGAAAGLAVVASVGILGPVASAFQGFATPSAGRVSEMQSASSVNTGQRAVESAASVSTDTRAAQVNQPTVIQVDPFAARRATAAACWGTDWGCVISELTSLSASLPNDDATRLALAAAQYNQGQQMLGSGDTRGALASFDQATKLDPMMAEALAAAEKIRSFDAAVAAYNTGDWLAASDGFALLVYGGRAELRGIAHASWVNLATTHLHDGNIQGAQDALTRSYEFGDSDAARVLRVQLQPRPVVVTRVRYAAPVAQVAPVEHKQEPAPAPVIPRITRPATVFVPTSDGLWSGSKGR